jgi:hypothetical protein
MATTTTNFGWDIPQSTDLVKDGATAIAALGQDIDTALVDLKGGTTGQVLAKATGTDLDFSWVTQDDANAIQNTIVDAKGDIITATGSDVPARLGVGANNEVLTADSSTATGLKWAAVGGGKILQVVRATDSTQRTTTSGTFVDVTGMTITITPQFSNSNIILITSNIIYATNVNFNARWQLTDSSNNAISGASEGLMEALGAGSMQTLIGFDTPGSTAAKTYKMRFRCNTSGTMEIWNHICTGQIYAIEVAA